MGHLSDAQTDALAEFKVELAKEGYYTPATETTDASHDEPTLLCVPSIRPTTLPWRLCRPWHTLLELCGLSQSILTRRVSLGSRFLRARKFDVPGAFAQFTTAEKWRKEEHVAETYDEFSVTGALPSCWYLGGS